MLTASNHAKLHGIADGFFVPKSTEYHRQCRYCGVRFVVPKPTRAEFCCRWCKLADRRENRTSEAKPRPVCVCLMCGKSFKAKRKDAKYCSRKCSTASQDRSAYMLGYYNEHREKWVESGKRRNAKRRLKRAARAGARICL